MRLDLANIGPFPKARIDLKGITVISGENNTGKSILSKTIYNFFQTMYQEAHDYKDFELSRIYRLLLENLFSRFFKEWDHHDYAFQAEILWAIDLKKSILKLRETPSLTPLAIKKEFLELIERLYECDKFKKLLRKKPKRKLIWQQILTPMQPQLLEILKVDYSKVIPCRYEERFDFNFARHLITKPFPVASIKLKFDKTNLTLTFNLEDKLRIDKFLNPPVLPLFFDNPNFLDYLSVDRFKSIASVVDRHKDELFWLLHDRVKEAQKEGQGLDFNYPKEMAEIFKEVCPGDLIYKTKPERCYYRENGLDFEPYNLSSAVKVFLILKSLYRFKLIDKGALMILDNFEAYLHPKWQILLARLLVILQKEFNLKLLISSQSIYFIRALEGFSRKQQVPSENCIYYFAKREEEFSSLTNCSQNLEIIYEGLADPLDDIESIFYE